MKYIDYELVNAGGDPAGQTDGHYAERSEMNLPAASCRELAS